MKPSIKTRLDAVEFDNKEFIKEEDMTVAEYLLFNSEQEDQGWLYYLTDEEIEEFENNDEIANKHIEEIKEFVNKYYDYKIEETFQIHFKI